MLRFSREKCCIVYQSAFNFGALTKFKNTLGYVSKLIILLVFGKIIVFKSASISSVRYVSHLHCRIVRQSCLASHDSFFHPNSVWLYEYPVRSKKSYQGIQNIQGTKEILAIQGKIGNVGYRKYCQYFENMGY